MSGADLANRMYSEYAAYLSESAFVLSGQEKNRSICPARFSSTTTTSVFMHVQAFDTTLSLRCCCCASSKRIAAHVDRLRQRCTTQHNLVRTKPSRCCPVSASEDASERISHTQRDVLLGAAATEIAGFGSNRISCRYKMLSTVGPRNDFKRSMAVSRTDDSSMIQNGSGRRGTRLICGAMRSRCEHEGIKKMCRQCEKTARFLDIVWFDC
jgi:hypothetical protein